MDPATAAASPSQAIVFQDGLGERRHITGPTGNETLEMLRLSGELTAIPAFEFALRERVNRLANFRHACYGHVRGVDRLNDPGATLALVSERTPGVRLSEMLAVVERQRVVLDINAALCLIWQLVPAVAVLHENERDVAHGAIGPERLVVTPQARLVIVEYVMGAALERLRFSHARYWKDLRIALPRTAGLAHFDHRADVTQIGVVALSLILGRPLRDDEYPSRIRELVASAWAISASGDAEPLTPGLRSWLARALQVDLRDGFPSALEARAALDEVLLGDGDYIAAPASLEAFLERYHASAAVPAEGAPAPIKADVARNVAQDFSPARRGAKPLPLPPPQPVREERKVVKARASHEMEAIEAEAKAAAEAEANVEAEAEAELPRRWSRLAAAAIVLIALASGAVLAARLYVLPAAAGASTGTLIIHTNPSGARVILDGEPRGVTPINLTLKAGAHVVELRGAGEPRKIPVTITAGAEASQYIELPKSGPTPGQLQIRTDPPGAQVTVDNLPRGASPLTIGDLAPGEHTVALESDLGSVKQSVAIESGKTASLVVPLTTPAVAPASGWLSVSSPVYMQLYENGRLIGSSQSEQIMISAGSHQIETVNEPLGYRVTHSVQVAPGKVAPITIKLPNGTIALNAIPWAEVWIDGEKVGETPIGNLTVPIGPHEIVFRNPDLGEQWQTVSVTLTTPARLSVDLRKQ